MEGAKPVANAHFQDYGPGSSLGTRILKDHIAPGYLLGYSIERSNLAKVDF